MKRLMILIWVSCLKGPVFAQDTSEKLLVDSNRIIQLKDLPVAGFRKTTQQRLMNFFRNNNAANLEDIMSRLPELCLIRRGSYGLEPSIRYFNGGQVNVQLDGMNIHGACTDKMDPATIYIEPVNLENLSVQTSNSGFMNGSAIGGTLNMKIAEPEYEPLNKVSGIFSSGCQSAAKSLYESLRLNYATGRFAVAASGTYRNNKDYRSGGGKVIPFSGYEKVNYSLSVKFRQNSRNYINADMIADDGWNIGYAALPMDVGYAAARIGSVSFHHENKAKRVYSYTVKLYANSVRHFMDDSKRPSVIMHMDMPGKSKTTGLYAEGEARLTKKQKLQFRADYSNTYLKASMTMHQAGQPGMYMLTWPDNRKYQYGLSASWIWQPERSLQLQLMGRADLISYKLASPEAKDHVAVFANSFDGRNDLLKNISLVVSKKTGNGFTVSAGAGYAERLATASELFGFYLFNASDGFDYIGNPGLQREKALQSDLSFSYTYKQNSIQLKGYYSRVADFIAGRVNPAYSTMTIGAKGVKTYVNLEYVTVTGAEATGVFKPFKHTDFISTIRYALSSDHNNEPMPSVSPIKNTNAIRYQPARFSIQLESEISLAQNRVSAGWGEDATAGYFLVHTRLGYNANILAGKTEIQAGVENIFDTKYHDHLDWGNISRPGRNFYIQLKIGFNN